MSEKNDDWGNRRSGFTHGWEAANEYNRNKIDKLTTTMVSYEATMGFLKDTLREIADEDYRSNRSMGSIKAYQALKMIGAYKESK